MANGSLRKRGKKWYYRFYVEDASGNSIQKEFTSTESKAETEKMLRRTLEKYESEHFIPKNDGITLGELLDEWADNELKPGDLANGTVNSYMHGISRIKQHPIGSRKLRTITVEHLQNFIDLLIFGGSEGNFSSYGYSQSYGMKFVAVLRHAFHYAVSPAKYILFNPMEYVTFKTVHDDPDLFAVYISPSENIVPITHDQYKLLISSLKISTPDAVLPIQIAYFTGLRIGEACGLTWDDIKTGEE